MTRAQVKIRREMIKWGSIGISASILSQDTGYAFITCKKEVQKVIAEGHTEDTGYSIILKNIDDFKRTLYI